MSLALIVLVAGCSSGQSFSQVAGDVRIQANLRLDPLSWKARTLEVRLSDVSTGDPVNGRVDVVAGGGPEIHAAAAGAGSYRASIPDADNIQLLVVARERVTSLALARH
ncbi:MAG TPA: hypothetical protein VFE17_07630 [Candidatus Baltobacteraceae bacterium]|nr:hypothetical protein [Candidatus Baltobacteraceae bacterium]